MYYSNQTIPFAPTLHPTVEEFRDFRKYVDRLFVNPKYTNAGCIKVT